MKARMKNNLVDLYTKALPKELDACDHQEQSERIEFLESIEGKEVELVFTGGDAFEKNDNNLWLPDSLWEEIN